MMITDLRYTGSNIERVLASQGRRKDWLAAQVGVSPSLISKWISGARLVNHANAMRVAASLGVPFDLIFESPKGNTTDPIDDTQELAS